MSRIIAELMGTSQPRLRLSLDRLESAVGNQGVDAQLTGEIITKIHLHTKALGLDPLDTTGPELYHGLLTLAAVHDRFLAKHLGGSDPTDVRDMLTRIQKCANELDVPRSVWVVKPSVAKRLLKKHPPKQLMKYLKYRSVDSLIKREPVSEILSTLRFIESETWMKKFIGSYASLTSSDFEHRNIQIIVLPADRWRNATASYVARTGNILTHLKEFGVITILPMPVDHVRGITIALLPRILHSMNELRAYSTYFKLHQVRPNFGPVISDVIVNEPAHYVTIAGQSVHWRLLQRHFHTSSSGAVPEFFEPHVMRDDLYWRKAEAIMYGIEPALHFWHDMDYVGAFIDGRPVSFNILDVSQNLINSVPYGSRGYSHLVQSLQNEIVLRYLKHQVLESQASHQLNDIINPEQILIKEHIRI